MPKRTINNSDQLLASGLVDRRQEDLIKKTEQQFAIRLTPQVQQRIHQHGDAVYQQYVPDEKELLIAEDELDDPIGDQTYAAVKGIIHRYPDRCLFNVISVCAVYCRFCFRREKVGKAPALTAQEIKQAIAYIANDTHIWEVILSGGDPLLLKANQLQQIIQQLDAIPHLNIIRLHTRIPVVDADRINDALISALKSTNKTVYIVLHTNHHQEFSTAAEQACAKIIDNGIPMLSQSVLLKGINDNEQALAALMKKLVSLRIKPYYLHQLDFAKGTGHFRVDIAKGQQLMRQLRQQLSGLCQPTYMLDHPDGLGKVPITPCYLDEKDEQ